LYGAPLRLDAASDDDPGLRRVRENLARANGVASVTVADGLPMDSRHRIARVSLETDTNVAPRVVSAHVTRVGNGYLSTMGIPLLRGRTVTAGDRAGAEMVTVISHALARELFRDAGADGAIGQRVTFAAPGDKARAPRTLTIVGVTADFPTSQLSFDRPQLLLPLAQHPDVRRDTVRINDDGPGTARVMIVARGAAGEPPSKLTAALEHAVRELDPDSSPPASSLARGFGKPAGVAF